MILLAILQFAIAMGVPVLIAALLAWGTTRRSLLTRPLCGRCRAALPFAAAVGEIPCPGCHEPVDDAHPPVPARRRGWSWPIAFGLLLLGLVLTVPFIVMTIATRQAFSVAGAAATQAMFSAGLRRLDPIETYLPELRQRALAGEDVVGIARETLRSSLPNVPPAPQAPATSVSEIATIAILGLPGVPPPPPPDAELATRVLIACFPPLAIAGPELAQGQVTPAYTGFYAPQSQLQRVARVTSATLDGAPVELTPLHGSPAPLLFDRMTPLRIAGKATPITGRFVLTLEVRLYSSFDAERTRDHRGAARPPELWPEPFAMTTITIEADATQTP